MEYAAHSVRSAERDPAVASYLKACQTAIAEKVKALCTTDKRADQEILRLEIDRIRKRMQIWKKRTETR